MIFSSQYVNSRTLLFTLFYPFCNSKVLCLVKICLIFDGSQSNRFTRYQKILWACLLGCKKLLNFICLLMKSHNHHHIKHRALLKSEKGQEIFFGSWHIEYEYLMAFMRYFISTFCVLSFLLLWTAFGYFRPFNTSPQSVFKKYPHF